MPSLSGPDGTRLAYHRSGEGAPLICLPGGPMQSSAYLGDLGGLTAHRSLVRLDLRGTGESAVPADPSTYRCDRQVDDVEALVAREAGGKNPEAAAAYYADGAVGVLATRTALARLDAPVLVVAGGYDVGLPPDRAAAYAALCGRGETAVLPGAGHYPWRDDPAWFVRTLAAFLT